MDEHLCACGCGLPTNQIKRTQTSAGYRQGEFFEYRLGHRLRGKRNLLTTRHGDVVGGKATLEYSTWKRIKRRCYNVNDKDYPDYGGNGIGVCDEWRNDFSAFLRDMGRKPSAAHSIDRIDNSRGYEPGNCRWATPTEQVRNRSNAVRITFNGETLSVAQWAERIGVRYSTLAARLRAGIAVERAVTMPLGSNHR